MARLTFAGADGPQRFELLERTTLGRSPECDVVLTDSSVSRRHARVEHTPEGWVLTDEGSRFGTFLGEARVTQPVLLPDGAQLRVGNVAVRFEERPGAAFDELEVTGNHRQGADTLPRMKLRLAELEQQVQRLTSAQKKSQALLELNQAFLKCTSAGMLLQAAGPDVVRALRAEAAFFALRSPNGELVGRFQHKLERLPAHRQADVARACSSGAVVAGQSGPEGRASLTAALMGPTGVEAIAYLELPGGKQPAPEDVELCGAMCRQLGSAIANLSLLQQVRREELARANLSRYVSDQVAKAIISGQLKLALGGARRQVTVVFVDVRGFTSMSERLPPEHVLALLNEHFAEAVPIIKRAQGTVDKFIGDALMAVFGAPNEQPDQAVRAVEAARAIRRATQALRQRWRERPWAASMDVERFAVGIGVNTGTAIAGNLGTDDRREYAVIGDAVNVASRLCSNAKPNQILIGPHTAAQLGGAVRLAPLEPLKVKGRQAPVEPFEVLDEA